MVPDGTKVVTQDMIFVPVEPYEGPPSEIITSNYRMRRKMTIGYLEAPSKDCLKLVGDTN